MTGAWSPHMISSVTQGQAMLLAEKRHTSRRFQGAILTRATMCRQMSRLTRLKGIDCLTSKFRAVLRIELLDVAQRQ